MRGHNLSTDHFSALDVSQSEAISEALRQDNSIIEEIIASDKEERTVGTITWEVFRTYIGVIGGLKIIILMVIAAVAMEGSMVAAFNFMEAASKNFNDETKYSNLVVLSGLWTLASFGGFFRKIIELYVSYKISTKMHSRMLKSLLHAEMEGFLDRVPYGQIQNRFSKDLSLIDKMGAANISNFIDAMIEALINLGTISWAIGTEMLFPMLIWFVVIYFLQKDYRNAKREYKRLNAISKSPMIDCASDSIKGLAYLRTMKITHFLKRKFIGASENIIKNELADFMLGAWFGARCSFSQQLLIQLPCLLGILYYFKDLNSAKIGLFFICIFNLGEILQRLMMTSTDYEASLVSVERSVFFTKLRPEKGYQNLVKEGKVIGIGSRKNMDELQKFEELRDQMERARRSNIQAGEKATRGLNRAKMDKQRQLATLESMVTRGEVIFENVTAKYLTSEDSVLKGLSFKIKPGEKIGIVGRTGSGKSSLIKLLWRYMDPTSGKIFIDGKNIRKVDVKALRNQMTVITQETSLFEGTLRENLDPSKFRFKDQELVQVLQRLEFGHSSYQKEGLDMLIDSEGNNLSQGERQLICFARSILRPTRLVLFDEATASIDLKTEETIQSSVKEFFEKSSMIVVAHRVQTVLECDRIMVLNQGEIADFDSPTNLMKSDGFFTDIMKKMGEQ